MAIRKYRDLPPGTRPATLEMISRMVAIVARYAEMGLRLTARQLYYQFVSKDWIPNTAASYKKLTRVLTDARYAGMVDWYAIEDRGRVPDHCSEWSSIQSLVESAVESYRLPRWEGQDSYVELWVEKQALAGVLEPLASEFHVTLMVNKGYSSASAMYESAQRFKANGRDRSILFYLGDHDPSGEDMVRDIGDRLEEFGVDDLHVKKLAITWDQIQEYGPEKCPPNPVKPSDSRANGYMEKYGTDECWEVDAIPPEDLQGIIRTAMEDVVDMTLMDEIKEREETDKARLTKAAAKL